MNGVKEKLLLAIPKKGRLNSESEAILQQAGILFKRSFRSDIALCTTLPIGIVFLPAKDISSYVAGGDVDLGISGKDLLLESKHKLNKKFALNYGRCKLCLLALDKNLLQKKQELVIATSYPTLTKSFFKNQGKKIKLIELSGSVEIAPALGLADAVVDLVETGETIKAMGLKILSVLLESEAQLIANPNTKHLKLLEQVCLRIGGVCKAKNYCMIEYNIQRKDLLLGEKITPGSTSPTIMPLENKNWLAVKSLIAKENSVEIMEKLEKIGAKDILIYDLQNCRI